MDEAAAADSGVLALMDNDFPLVFIDTSAAVALKGETSPHDENRRVAVRWSDGEPHAILAVEGEAEHLRGSCTFCFL